MQDGSQVVVTLADVYREVRALSVTLQQSVAEQTSANALRMAEVAELRERATDHERRLRKVEHWAAALSLTFVGGLVTFFVAVAQVG